MGKHSTHEQSDFYRSAVMWFLPWLVGGVVAIGALWIGIDALSGDVRLQLRDPSRQGAIANSKSPSPEATATEPSPGSSSSDARTAPPKKDHKGSKLKLISEGVSVQVLNGTTIDDADDRVADELEGFGFEIVAVNPWHPTAETVVYWTSPDDEKAAVLLADKLDWRVEPKPADLSAEVAIHVLVGGDEAVPE